MSLVLLFFEGGGGVEVEPPSIVVRQRLAYPLACELLLEGQASVRFGPDEADAGDIIRDPAWATQNPGGHGDGSIILSRPPWIRTEDSPLFAGGRIYGPGGKEHYSGSVKGTPQIGVNDIRIDFEGWVSALDDDEFFRLLGVHNDLTEWTGPSVQRQLNHATAVIPVQSDGGAEQDTTGLSALSTRLVGPWAANSRCEFWLYVEGLVMASERVAWKKSAIIDNTNTNWGWGSALSDNDVLTTSDSSGELRAAGPGTAAVAATGVRKHATVWLKYDVAVPGSDGLPHDIFWTALSVFGDHGLTARALDDGRYGLLGSDALRYAIDRVPELIYTPQSVEDSFHVFPHLVHTEGGVRGLVEHITAFGGSSGELNDWGAWGREFFWRSPGSHGTTWRVRRDQVATPMEEGPIADQRCRSIVVTYQDGAGKTRSVGPVGSGADYETDLLEDTSPENPATRRPTLRKRRGAGLTSQEGAVFVGQALLAEQNQNTRRGSVELQGYVTDEAGNEYPACEVRACDRLLIEDEDGVNPEVQPINSTSNNGAFNATANVGATPHRVEVLLARLEAATTGIA